MKMSSQPVTRNLGVQQRSDPPSKCGLISKSNRTLMFGFGLMALYLALFLFYDKLRFPMIWDESHYWETTLRFSESSLPDLELLRNYSELNTPLPFIIFAGLENLSKDGLFAGRFLNLILSVIMIWSIGAPLEGRVKHRFLSVVGILIVPYYLWLSSHFYTDILAVFFVFAGFWLYSRNRHVLSGVPFILAIACRQYMLAFPLAIACYEVTSTFARALESGSLRSAAQAILKNGIRWIPPLTAALTIFFWFWLFGGIAPKTGIAMEAAPQVQKETWAVGVDASLYFVACLGFYFVIPEWFLFVRRVNLKSVFTRKNAASALGLLLLFAAFPPSVTVTHGLLTKFARLLPVDFLRTALFYCLALLACVRFSRFNLASWVVLLAGVLMLKAHPWDKYVVPLVVVFWYLKSIDMLDTIPLRLHGRLGRRPLRVAARQGSKASVEVAGCR